MIEHIAPRTTIHFDNLRGAMREAYYDVLTAGIRPTHLLASGTALRGYEAHAGQNDPPVTTFKGLPIYCDPTMPHDEMRLLNGGEVVAVIRYIS